MTIWCERFLSSTGLIEDVRLSTDEHGRITSVEAGAQPGTADLRLGLVVRGMVNAHSHAFHRLLRGTTHADGGDFWQWRESMYELAAVLEPALYRVVARAVFAEMLTVGWTTVGEFHYLHHHTDGTPYTNPEHAMELALAEAAHDVGIRLVLLDSCYLTGDIERPLGHRQRRFGDADADAWLARWSSLREALSPFPTVTLGASIHSVRAVPPAAFSTIRDGLPDDVPLHVHLSEQRRENETCLARYGVTPTAHLAEHGLLDARTSLVHATHLSGDDEALIGRSGATVVMCPTTEADLGDGIGPAHRVHERGGRIALGSDQNAVIDPFLEIRGLEMGERLRYERRGRFSPAELLDAATRNGMRSLGTFAATEPASASDLPVVGELCDMIELDARSMRTAGSDLDQIVLTASAADVLRVVVGGRLVAEDRVVITADERYLSPSDLLSEAFDQIGHARKEAIA